MLQDTRRPTGVETPADPSDWDEYRVGHPQERLRLLRELLDRGTQVLLSPPSGGETLSTSVSAVDDKLQRLSLSARTEAPQLPPVAKADAVVAVAYHESVKLQFGLRGITVNDHGTGLSTLQCLLPEDIYRFQRRGAFRVRVPDRQPPMAKFRHPAMPEMNLALRVLDLSIGGCALWLPSDVPPLQAGTRFAEVVIELDAQTRFSSGMSLQHVSAIGPGADGAQPGARLGCEWQRLGGTAERELQRWIDRAQQRRRQLTA